MPKEIKEHSIHNKNCSILICSKKAIRNFPEGEWDSAVKLAGLRFVSNRRSRIYLCKEHYNQAKKYKSKSNKSGANRKGFLVNSPKPSKMRM